MIILNKDPWGQIKSGIKTLEIRGYSLEPGLYYVANACFVVGAIIVEESFVVENLDHWKRLQFRHLWKNVGELPYPKTCANPIRSVFAFIEPVPYQHLRGAFRPLFRPRLTPPTAKASAAALRFQAETAPGVFRANAPLDDAPEGGPEEVECDEDVEVLPRHRPSDGPIVAPLGTEPTEDDARTTPTRKRWKQLSAENLTKLAEGYGFFVSYIKWNHLPTPTMTIMLNKNTFAILRTRLSNKNVFTHVTVLATNETLSFQNIVTTNPNDFPNTWETIQ